MTTATLPALGLHSGIDADTYHAIDACSSTRLKWLGERSPAYCRYRIDHPQEPTDAMRRGTAVHFAVLEPDLVESVYVAAGQCEAEKKDGSRCQNDGKILRGDSWWCGVHRRQAPPEEPDTPPETRRVIEQAELDRILRIRDSVHAHPEAVALLRGSRGYEVSGLWREPCHGDLLCKMRPDVVGDGYLADLKVTRQAHPDRFGSFLLKHGAHRQAAVYVRGMEMTTDEPVTRFAFVAVEPEPPHECCVFDLDAPSLEAGQADMRRLMHMYAECKRTNVWPGYEGGVIPVNLPDWYLNMLGPDRMTGLDLSGLEVEDDG